KLASDYRALGRNQDAINLDERTLAARELLLGHEHPGVGNLSLGRRRRIVELRQPLLQPTVLLQPRVDRSQRRRDRLQPDIAHPQVEGRRPHARAHAGRKRSLLSRSVARSPRLQALLERQRRRPLPDPRWW
ncbi:MAG: tetratricopeptide repeat protein, partial [Acidobacteria bacterium]|nr:tetratricopeptide repeat protein [Acidobacteriota bacterium]